MENLHLAEFHTPNPGSALAVLEAEAALGLDLPEDYRSFLCTYDGGEGFVGEHYLVLWAAAELKPYNTDYGFPEFAPALIGFGGDGGGEAFAFDTRARPYPIVIVPLIGMSEKDAIPVADSFSGLLKRMQTDPGSLFDRNLLPR
jgi:hypothetical protein